MRNKAELGEMTHPSNIGVYPLRKSTAFSGCMVFLLGKPRLELLGYMEVKEDLSNNSSHIRSQHFCPVLPLTLSHLCVPGRSFPGFLSSCVNYT